LTLSGLALNVFISEYLLAASGAVTEIGSNKGAR
jgi:hypothetical protein